MYRFRQKGDLHKMWRVPRDRDTTMIPIDA
jgi:hypothetical protein